MMLSVNNRKLTLPIKLMLLLRRPLKKKTNRQSNLDLAQLALSLPEYIPPNDIYDYYRLHVEEVGIRVCGTFRDFCMMRGITPDGDEFTDLNNPRPSKLR